MIKFCNLVHAIYLKMSMFIQITFNICILYTCIYIIYIILNFFVVGHYGFGVVILCNLSLLIFTDNTIVFNRKLIFLCLILFQVFAYIYWDLLYIDIFKDIFWFSVLLNGAFIWQVLVLARIYRFLLKKSPGYDYIRFLVSRLSYISSLSLLVIIIKYIIFILDLVERYIVIILRIYPETWKSRYRLLVFLYDNHFIGCCKYILCLVINILLFFIKIFMNYSLFLVGKRSINLKIDRYLFGYILLLLLTILLSIILNIPRLYFLWTFIFILHYIIVISCLNLIFEDHVKTRWYLLPFQIHKWYIYLYGWYLHIYITYYHKEILVIFEKWDVLYGFKFYSDLYNFLSVTEYIANYACTDYILFGFESINIYDLLRLFWYDKCADSVTFWFQVRMVDVALIEDDLRNSISLAYTNDMKQLCIRKNIPDMIKFKSNIEEIIIKPYSFNITVDEFISLVNCYRVSGKYPLIWISKQKPITLTKYIFGLSTGSYVFPFHVF